MLDLWLQRLWYQGKPMWASMLLMPLSWLFLCAVCVRRLAYRSGLWRSIRVGVPVIIVGNITVGGTGKTPLVLWLAARLQERGVRVAIITRGYGGQGSAWPVEVNRQSDPSQVGDEASVLARRSSAIVVAAPDRVAAAQLAKERGAEIIVADDGLQHYALARDFEVIVVDGQRRFGNQRLLPAGPLREPLSRLRTADLIVISERGEHAVGRTSASELMIKHVLRDVYNLKSGEARSLASFAGEQVHAVAAIGNPNAFFTALEQLGLHVKSHPLPDHTRLRAADISFADSAPVLMTEKDAVKCADFAGERHWVVRSDVELSPEAEAELWSRLQRRLHLQVAP